MSNFVLSQLGIVTTYGPLPAGATALHEAGHAVVAYAHGVPIRRACGKPIPSMRGAVGHVLFRRLDDADNRARVQIALAGVAVETLWLRERRVLSGCEHDAAAAWNALEGFSAGERARILGNELVEARRILIDRWHVVDALATELDGACLTGRQIRELIEELEG